MAGPSMHMDAYASDHAHGAATDMDDYPGPNNGALRDKVLTIIMLVLRLTHSAAGYLYAIA